MKNKKDISILIPSRNEMFLARTIEDLLANSESDFEIIATLDGKWADPGVPQHEKVNIIYVPESIGQRAATNIACKMAKGKYVVKVDAHTSYDKGWDVKMLDFYREVGDNVTAVPIMKNLHAFDWKCYTCGSRWYQGPTPTQCMRMNGHSTVKNEKCNETRNFKRKMTWEPRRGTHSTSYCFDSEPHFQYFNDYTKRKEYIESLQRNGYTETMSLQGSFFMSTREKYWELNLSDEDVGSWGNQGLEVACKTWLSGGRVLVNHKTWYSHMFRTQGGDFSFPYEQSGNAIDKTKKKVWDHFFDGRFKQQIRPVSWLVEKFWPIPSDVRKDNQKSVGWTDEALTRLKQREGVI